METRHSEKDELEEDGFEIVLEIAGIIVGSTKMIAT